jgi:hypothetical protein
MPCNLTQEDRTKKRRRRVTLKPRSNSILEPRLNDEIEEKLFQWLVNENLPYAEVIERLQKQHAVKATFKSLSRYYKHHCYPALLERRAQARQKAIFLYRHKEQEPGQMYDLAISDVERRVMKLAEADDINPADLIKLLRAINEHKKLQYDGLRLDQQERRLRIVEKRLAEQERATTTRRRVDDQEFIEHMRTIFKGAQNGANENHQNGSRIPA